MSKYQKKKNKKQLFYRKYQIFQRGNKMKNFFKVIIIFVVSFIIYFKKIWTIKLQTNFFLCQAIDNIDNYFR